MKLFRQEQQIHERVVDGVVIQVVERGEQRELRFGNHITQSARSLVAPGMLLLDYTRAMMAGFLFAPQAARLLHFGLGGGSLPDFIHRHVPQAFQRVVELNPGVVDVAYRYFDLPVSPRLEVVVQEGADFLRQHSERYDLIFLDAFHADGAAPHLNSATVLRMLAARLAPGGWLVDNVWGSDRENLIRVRGQLAAAFPQLVSLSVRADSNVIFVVGSQERMPSNQAILRRAETLSRSFPLDFTAIARRCRPLFPSESYSPASPGPAR